MWREMNATALYVTLQKEYTIELLRSCLSRCVCNTSNMGPIRAMRDRRLDSKSILNLEPGKTNRLNLRDRTNEKITKDFKCYTNTDVEPLGKEKRMKAQSVEDAIDENNTTILEKHSTIDSIAGLTNLDVNSMPTTQQSKLNRLRRNLRATIVSPKGHSNQKLQNTTPSSADSADGNDLSLSEITEDRATKPQVRLEMCTPISLLNGEMNQGGDVSLLYSPSVVAGADNSPNKGKTIGIDNAVSNSCMYQNRVTIPQSRLSMISEAAQGTEKNSIGQKVRKTRSFAVTPQSRTRPPCFKKSIVQQQQIGNEVGSLKKSLAGEIETPFSSISKESKKEMRISFDISMVVSQSDPKTIVAKTSDYVQYENDDNSRTKPDSTMHSKPEECDESISNMTGPWYSAIPDSIICKSKAQSATSYTPRGNGYCMDLTDIFVDVAATKSHVPKANHNQQAAESCSNILGDKRIVVENYHVECEEWAFKQCQSFAQWLNFIFEPIEDKEFDNADDASDQLALRTLVVHRRMAEMRFNASSLFKSNCMTRIKSIISTEVQNGRIAIRNDRNLHADVSMRSQLMNLLFSYAIPWLRLGLETLFGEPILPVDKIAKSSLLTKAGVQSDNKLPYSRMELALRSFIVDRVLSDSRLLVRYTKGRCLLPSGKFEKKYCKELNSKILNRILVLVIFLDHAKQANLLDKVPNLFLQNAQVKSTRDVLLSFCRNFLQAEGDFIKHLSRLGVNVSYKQENVDELCFHVTNLAVDLRDGTRLVKLVEVLTATTQKSLLGHLRLPAVSRLQKLHNVGIALKELSRCGMSLTTDISAYHIVDGHRQMVLKLLWAIVTHFCFKKLLDVQKIEREIFRISGSGYQSANDNATQMEGGLNQLKEVLIRWCHAVCSRFGKSVSNLSTDFADGSVICLIIHYYHPGLFHRDEIYRHCTDIQMTSEHTAEDRDRVTVLQHSNAHLANKAMAQIGGIPEMIPICNTFSPPEEKTVLFCLSFVCSRLIESNLEERSCSLIQRWYRPFHDARDRMRKAISASIIYQAWKENKSIYYHNQLCKYKSPVLKIEGFLRRYSQSLVRLRESRISRELFTAAVIVIQKNVRANRERKQVARLLLISRSVMRLQSFVRMTIAIRVRKFLHTRIFAVVKIQRSYNDFRLRLSNKTAAAVEIQRLWRGFWCQLQFQIDMFDIVSIQTYVRLRVQQKKYVMTMHATKEIQNFLRDCMKRHRLLRASAANRIQCMFRRFAAKAELIQRRGHRKSVILVQTRWRMYLSYTLTTQLKKNARRMAAATRLQTSFRRYAAILRSIGIKKKRQQRIASTKLQTQYRAWSSRNYVRCKRRRWLAILAIQCFIRGVLAEKTTQKLRLNSSRFKASVTIQRLWRATSTRNRLQRIKYVCLHGHDMCEKERNASIAIQKTFRRKSIYDWIKSINEAATKLQSIVRMRSLAHAFSRCSCNAVVIQAFWRHLLMRLKYDRLRNRIVMCQSYWRRVLALRTRDAKTSSILKLQLFFRICMAKSIFMLLKHTYMRRMRSATLLQRTTRKYLMKKEYGRRMRSVVSLQFFCRKQIAKRIVRVRKRATTLLQYAIRIFLARRTIERLRKEKRNYESFLNNTAVKVQSAYRGSVARNQLRLYNTSATKIQSKFRAFWFRKYFREFILDVILTQIVVRQWIARKLVLRRVNAIIRLQQFTRRISARVLLKTLKSLKTMQRIVRGHQARFLSLQHRCARIIQKTWRCYDVHCDYMILCIHTTKMQAYTRRNFYKKKFMRQRNAARVLQALCCRILERNHELRLELASIVLQSVCRMLPRRKQFIELQIRNRTATSIQALVRLYRAKSAYNVALVSVLVLQRNVRGFIQRHRFLKRKRATLQLQRIWRGYFAYTEYAMKILSIVKLQSIFRMVACCIKCNNIRNEMLAASHFLSICAKRIQRSFLSFRQKALMHHAALDIQRTVRAFLCKLFAARLRKGIVCFQSAVRGRKTRSKRTKAVRSQAMRVAIANDVARTDPKLQLGNRARAALDILMRSRSLSEIMSAICLLELATRFSEVCCNAFAHAGAANIVFPLIRSCNRSLPHIQILRYVLLTFTNVTKYSYLVSSIATTEAFDVFLDLVQMFRDKDGIFPLAASLLERVFSFDDTVQSNCASRENRKRIQGIVALVSRKMSMSGIDPTMSTDTVLVTPVTRSRSAKRVKSTAKPSSVPIIPEADGYIQGLHALRLVLSAMAPKNVYVPSN